MWYLIVVSEIDSERFWERVNKTDDCWLWVGPGSRYGRLGFGRNQGAHRASWELHNGPIPDGFLVLHHCDTPRCVRPDHLFLGTQRDNIADARAKDRLATGDRHGLRKHPERRATGERHGSQTMPERWRRGETHYAALLTEEDVRKIKKRLSEGEFHSSIAMSFGVTREAISRIAQGKNWKHVI